MLITAVNWALERIANHSLADHSINNSLKEMIHFWGRHHKWF